MWPNDSMKIVRKIGRPGSPISLIYPFPGAFAFFWKILLMFISLGNNVLFLLLACWHLAYWKGYNSPSLLHASFPFPRLPHVTSRVSVCRSFFQISMIPQSVLPMWTSGLLSWGEYLGNRILKLTFNQSYISLAERRFYFVTSYEVWIFWNHFL